MATLVDTTTGQHHALGFRQVIGRSPSADIVCAASAISGSHLLIRFDGPDWTARDLGSRNGTRLGDAPLPPGQDAALCEGDLLHLAGATTLRVLDVSPPVPRALRADGEGEPAEILASEGFIVFGDEASDLHGAVFRGGGGGWILDEAGEERPVSAGDVVVVDGVAWRLDLPDEHGETLREGASLTHRSEPVLELKVSRDQEYIESTVIVGATRHELGPRAFGELLHLLAQARMEDAADEGIPERSSGWRYTDQVQAQLARSRTQVNLDVYRARKALASLDLPHAGDIVQRRTSTSQMRLGLSQVRILPA